MAGWPAANDPRDEFVVWKVEEHARAWILRFETRRWLDTRDFREQSIGACPFVVDKTRRQATDGLTSERDRLCVEATAGGRNMPNRSPRSLPKGGVSPEIGFLCPWEVVRMWCGCDDSARPTQYRALSGSVVMVELRGFEPLTFSLRTRRATNCAIAPCGRPI